MSPLALVAEQHVCSLVQLDEDCHGLPLQQTSSLNIPSQCESILSIEHQGLQAILQQGLHFRQSSADSPVRYSPGEPSASEAYRYCDDPWAAIDPGPS